MHKSLAFLAILAVLAASFAVPIGFARAADVAPAEYEVRGAHCDERGGIDGLLIHVEKPGRRVLQWSNARQCGTPI